jgi:hypothetical protein
MVRSVSNTESIAESLVFLNANRDILDQLAIDTHQWCLGFHGYKAVGNQYADLYERVAK